MGSVTDSFYGFLFMYILYILIFKDLDLFSKLCEIVGAICIVKALVWCIECLFPKIPLPRLSQSFLQNFITKLKNPIESTTLVSQDSQWKKVHQELLKDLAIVPILGFDCEWVNNRWIKYEVGQVALVQLATYTGRCVLVRVCKHFPPSLRDILEDVKILKVGVDVSKDTTKLYDGYKVTVRGAFGVWNLSNKYDFSHRCYLPPNPSLANLSKVHLDVELNKDWNISCSNWEADLLTIQQFIYAAQDALASLAVCLKMVSDIYSPDNNDSIDRSNLESFYSSWSKTVDVS